METGGGKAKRKSISGKLLQDPSAVSFVSEGLTLKENELACASPKDAGEVRSGDVTLKWALPAAEGTFGSSYLAVGSTGLALV